MSDTRLKKRSVLISGHDTSVSLENAFWDALKDVAQARGLSINALITEIDEARADDPAPGSLSGAIRVYLLKTVSGSTSA